ncbi:MAG: hypothetical protein N2489_04515 [Clostridia bacterium]|nr:hypothetical protein [Clostridia bacterium]
MSDSQKTKSITDNFGLVIGLCFGTCIGVVFKNLVFMLVGVAAGIIYDSYAAKKKR